MTDGARRCLFCGSGGTMSREHIFADWINDVVPTEGKHKFTGGQFNRLTRDFGTGPAFARTVKEVCASCNNGWMSALESGVRPALAPLMQGQRTLPPANATPAVGRWILKTGMMALRMSIAEDRATGYGLPPEEFHELYEHRNDGSPVDHAQFWVGRYDGDLAGVGTWTLPIVVTARGLEQPVYPHGYVTTLLIGKLVLVGVNTWCGKLLGTVR